MHTLMELYVSFWHENDQFLGGKFKSLNLDAVTAFNVRNYLKRAISILEILY